MKSFLKVLTDTIPVILGVLIALFIGNWKQDLDDKKFLDKIYLNIEKEMNSNLESFETILPIQKALIDSLDLYRTDRDVSLVDVLYKTGGIQIPTIRNSSWNSFLNSKLELVDFEVITVTSEIAEHKVYMRSKVDLLQSFVIDNLDATDNRSKERLVISIKDLMETEQQLIELYQKYLKWRVGESKGT